PAAPGAVGIAAQPAGDAVVGLEDELETAGLVGRDRPDLLGRAAALADAVAAEQLKRPAFGRQQRVVEAANADQLALQRERFGRPDRWMEDLAVPQRLQRGDEGQALRLVKEIRDWP